MDRYSVQIQQTRDFQEMIQSRQAELQYHIDDLEHALVPMYAMEMEVTYRELLERQFSEQDSIGEHLIAYRQFYLMSIEVINPAIEETERCLRMAKAELLEITPPQEFLERYGWVMYRLYKQKYPLMNGETNLICADYTKGPEVRYAIPAEVMTDWLSTQESSLSLSSLSLETGQAYFEEWTDHVYRFRLAYAKEINAIFYKTAQPI